MLEKTKITGVILAGGKSSRFGSNKALSLYGKKNFIQHAYDLLHPVSDEIVISGYYPEYENLKLKMLEDIYPGIGPVGGLYTALKNSQTEFVLVVTCDMPLITPAILQFMLDNREAYELVGWSNSRYSANFPLLLSRNVLPALEKNIAAKKYKVKLLFENTRSTRIETPPQWESAFVNINTQEDYSTNLT